MLSRMKEVIVAAFCVATLGVATMAPANADGAASTRNIIFGIGALGGAAAAIGSNIAHKKAQAQTDTRDQEQAGTVSGYTSDGAKVMSNGQVFMPNGQPYYPADYNQTVSCNN